jgi:uncharacterized membrane protein YadS
MEKVIKRRFFFAIALVAFGIQHFIYAKLRGWIWAAVVSAASVLGLFYRRRSCRAGVSIATKKQARLAAILLGVMFFLR